MTDASSGIHAINIVLDRLVKATELWSGLKADIVRSSPIVSIKDNYDRLYYEPEAVARSARYSHYVDDETRFTRSFTRGQAATSVRFHRLNHIRLKVQ